METTFMTVHNLGLDARIMFASESIVDILGFQPEEVIGRSSFDYFHPDEVDKAISIHRHGLAMDRAAVLHYARIRNRDGVWVGCECVFTVVYEVLVACTSIYKGDAKSHRRAHDAPRIRRLFTLPPRDPRYHMLEHLSAKFRTPPQASLREPRAALILNRFTRNLTVMFATNAVSSILGISPDELKDRSFYEYMQENCVPEAIRCLESAKANDSIAYLRFELRNPRREEESDEEMREASQSSDSEDGGVQLGNASMDLDPGLVGTAAAAASEISGNGSSSTMAAFLPPGHNTRAFSGGSTDLEQDAARSSTSSLPPVSPEERPRRRVTRSPRPAPAPAPAPIEIEAVVSCTSDGLVVVLRRARPPVMASLQPPAPLDGLFAAPWGATPIHPHVSQPNAPFPFQHGPQAPQLPVGGPLQADFMSAIREVGVFAWGLTGINGNIASYARGLPRGESQPPDGLPIWDPYGQPRPGCTPPENQAAQKWSRLDAKTHEQQSGNMPLQHPRQEHLLARQGYGDHFSPERGPMMYQPAPAYTFEPQPGHGTGHPSWGTGPSRAVEQQPQATQPQSSQSPRQTTYGNQHPQY